MTDRARIIELVDDIYHLMMDGYNKAAADLLEQYINELGLDVHKLNGIIEGQKAEAKAAYDRPDLMAEIERLSAEAQRLSSFVGQLSRDNAAVHQEKDHLASMLASSMEVRVELQNDVSQLIKENENLKAQMIVVRSSPTRTVVIRERNRGQT